MKIHVDIETYCPVDLSSSNVYVYTQHQDFRILMLAYCVGDGDIKIEEYSCNEDVLLGDFYKLVKETDYSLCAHNANFERVCLNSIGINTKIERWECTAARSSVYGLRKASLDYVAKSLNLNIQKDEKGKRLVKLFSSPGRLKEAPNDWEDFKKYCKQDVAVERELDSILPHLDSFERKCYIVDQEINDRGILFDKDFATNAVVDCDKFISALRIETSIVYGVANINSPSQVKNYINNNSNKNVDSVSKDVLQSLVEDKSLPSDIKNVVNARLRCSNSSSKKYAAMIKCGSRDNRIRGAFRYYGASRSGRWAGRGVQLHNLRRDAISSDEAKTMLQDKNADILDIYGRACRSCFKPSYGNKFYVSDYSAIEARVLSWIAGESWRLEEFRGEGKIYEASAERLFGVKKETITKDSEVRWKAKCAELALGYQGGTNALSNFVKEGAMSYFEMMSLVTKWRNANLKISRLWPDFEVAFRKCIYYKGKTLLNNIKIFYEDGHVKILLPSGRCLNYPLARIEPNGKITYGFGADREITYGGKLTENVVQAISRDILAEAMIAIRDAGYNIVGHVHDEIIVEISEKTNTLELDKLMTNISWAKGLPLSVSSEIRNEYGK